LAQNSGNALRALLDYLSHSLSADSKTRGWLSAFQGIENKSLAKPTQ